jgi:hypothetical protein
MAFRWFNVITGYKPRQVTFLIAGELGQIKLPDLTEQRDLGVRQVVGHPVLSGPDLGTIPLIVAGGNSPPRVNAATII